MKCPKCGKKIVDDSVYCAYCGCKIQQKRRSFVPWIILIVLGGLCVTGIRVYFCYDLLVKHDSITELEYFEHEFEEVVILAPVDILEEEQDQEEVVIEAPIGFPEEEDDEDVPFKIIESQPEFPGGDKALIKFLSENVKYPVIAQENGIGGRVICQFVVAEDGSIRDAKVVHSGGDESLDKEVLRVINSMPKWKPGMQRGKPVPVKFTLPVNFKLQ